MRDIQALINEVNNAIIEMAEAKKELRDATTQLVNQMKADGRTMKEGRAYIDMVTADFPARTKVWAVAFFEQSWSATSE